MVTLSGGVRLKDVLDRAGVARGGSGALQGSTPACCRKHRIHESLAVDHARDGEVMIAYEMNASRCATERIPAADWWCRVWYPRIG